MPAPLPRFVSSFVVLAVVACGGTATSSTQSDHDARSGSGGVTSTTEAGTRSTGGLTSSGGKCGNSCAPVALAIGQMHPYAIAVDATSVYWTNFASPTGGGTVMKVPIAGGQPTTLASAQNWPHGIAVDATNVYWANSGSGSGDGAVMTVPLDGSTPMTLASGQDPLSIAVDSTSVYWTNSHGGTVMKVPLAGGSSTVLASDLSSQDAKIAIDGTSVYWTNFTALTVNKVSLTGGTPTILASNQSANTIAVDATNVYWMDDWVNDGRVMKMPLAGGEPTVLFALGQQTPGNIVADDTSVYWTTLGTGTGNGNPTGNDGTVMKLSRVGSPPTVLASGEALPMAIAVDATSVYWADFRNGAIMKLAPK